MSKRNRHLFRKGIESLKNNGFRATLLVILEKLRIKYRSRGVASRFTKAELAAQREAVFPKPIRFSIIVPLYNTPEKFLREMIESVLNQTYSSFELCLADGSDDAHERVGQICMAYANADARIQYRRLEKNLGISGNTNACLDMATGDYICLFDHDDLLHPAALHEVMRAICEQNADFIYTDEMVFYRKLSHVITVHYKPDFGPDNLRANNYICHFSVFSKEVLRLAGKFRSEYDGSQDHDFILRATEVAKKIVHIPEVLYFWRSHPGSVASDISVKSYAADAGRRAVADHLRRMGMDAEVTSSDIFPAIYRIKYAISGNPLVSIVIPNANASESLDRCINSILSKTTYSNYEIIAIGNENGKYAEPSLHDGIRFLTCPDSLGSAERINLGAKQARGAYILLLDSNMEIISPDWISEMLMYAERHDVGAVGAKLYYSNGDVLHGGMILGLGKHHVAGYAFRSAHKGNHVYMGRLFYAQEYSAVSGACMMLRREVWEEIGGFDGMFDSMYGDIDLCLRIRRSGRLIVYTPYAELCHHGVKSRGKKETPEQKKKTFDAVQCFRTRFAKELDAGDPYYNPNLTLKYTSFSPK